MAKRFFWACCMALALTISAVVLRATFTPLCGGGASCAYIANDPKWGYQTANLIRTNFNDHETRLLAVEAAYITAGSTTTLLNKTLNAESTGNVLTLPFTEYWPAAICDQGAVYAPLWSSNAPGEPVYGTCIAGTNNQGGRLNFEDTATGTIWQQFPLPSDWAGAIDARIFWTSAATTGSVVWQIQTACTADSETIDPTWNTAQTVTDATQGTANRWNTATLTSLTTTGCAAGEMFWFRLVRNPAHASDTLASTATFYGLELTYRRAM